VRRRISFSFLKVSIRLAPSLSYCRLASLRLLRSLPFPPAPTAFSILGLFGRFGGFLPVSQPFAATLRHSTGRGFDDFKLPTFPSFDPLKSSPISVLMLWCLCPRTHQRGPELLPCFFWLSLLGCFRHGLQKNFPR